MRALAVRLPSDYIASLGWHLWRCLATHSELEVEHEAGDVVIAPTGVRCIRQLLCCLLGVLHVTLQSTTLAELPSGSLLALTDCELLATFPLAIDMMQPW